MIEYNFKVSSIYVDWMERKKSKLRKVLLFGSQFLIVKVLYLMLFLLMIFWQGFGQEQPADSEE